MPDLSDYERFKHGMATEAEDRYLPMVDIYMSHYGPVQISPSEAAILRRDDEISRGAAPQIINLLGSAAVQEKASLLRKAIDRVAAWKAA